MILENLTGSYIYVERYVLAPAGGTATVPDINYNIDNLLADRINSMYAGGSIDVTSPPAGFPRSINLSGDGGGVDTDDQTASEVPITDSGSFYTDTDVEGALQQVGTAVTELLDGSIAVVIGTGSEVPSTGLQGVVSVPYDCIIDAVRLLADQSGDIVIDIWADSYANYPPDNSDSIVASAKPTLSSDDKYEDTTLTGWSSTLSKGDILGFEVESVATVQRVVLILDITRSY